VKLHTVLSSFAVFAFAEAAFSFPENTRLGYSSCVSCHVDPTGGGILNDYGKSSAGAYLAMFHDDSEDDSETKWIAIGADIRTVHIKQDSVSEKTRTNHLLMQGEIQAAGYLSDQITVSGSFGLYGKKIEGLQRFTNDYRESKFSSYYLMLKPRPFYIVRAGLFTPAYGLKIADHTAAIRSVFKPASLPQKQGVEADILLKYGELNFGGFRDEDGDWTALRGALYLGNASQLGLTFFGSPTKGYRAGTFGIVGADKFYMLAEIDYVMSLNRVQFVGYSKIGQELIKGLQAYTVNSKIWSEGGTVPNLYSVGLDWFPVVHFETSLELRNYDIPTERTYVLMTHLYF